MAIDEVFGPDGTQPLPPDPVLPDPLAGLITGEFLVADEFTAGAPAAVADGPAPALSAARSQPPKRRKAPVKRQTTDWSYTPAEFAPATLDASRRPATAVPSARTPDVIRAATATGRTPAAVGPSRAPARPATVPARPALTVGRPAIAPGRKPTAIRPAGGRQSAYGQSPVRGGAAPRMRKRRSGGGVVTTILVIIVLVLIYFGSGIVHVLTQLFH